MRQWTATDGKRRRASRRRQGHARGQRAARSQRRAAALEGEVAYADSDVGGPPPRRQRDCRAASSLTSAVKHSNCSDATSATTISARHGTPTSARWPSPTLRGWLIWRLRALHELGNNEMYDHAGTERLHRGPPQRGRPRRGQHRSAHRPPAMRRLHVRSPCHPAALLGCTFTMRGTRAGSWRGRRQRPRAVHDRSGSRLDRQPQPVIIDSRLMRDGGIKAGGSPELAIAVSSRSADEPGWP